MWGEGKKEMPRVAVSALAFSQFSIIEKIFTQWNWVQFLKIIFIFISSAICQPKSEGITLEESSIHFLMIPSSKVMICKFHLGIFYVSSQDWHPSQPFLNKLSAQKENWAYNVSAWSPLRGQAPKGQQRIKKERVLICQQVIWYVV